MLGAAESTLHVLTHLLLSTGKHWSHRDRDKVVHSSHEVNGKARIQTH